MNLEVKRKEILTGLHDKREVLIKEALQRALLVDIQSVADVEMFKDRLTVKEYIQSHTEYHLDGECFLWVGPYELKTGDDGSVHFGFDYKFIGVAL